MNCLITWWSDLPAILAADSIYKNPTSVNTAASQATTDTPNFTALDHRLDKRVAYLEV
jgi:hypothetical protein